MDHHDMLNMEESSSSEPHAVLAVTQPVDSSDQLHSVETHMKDDHGEALISTTTAATLLPEHTGLVLVETSRGNLLLTLGNPDMPMTTADLQGRQLLTTTLPMTGILTQVQNGLVDPQGATLLVSQPATEGAVGDETYETTIPSQGTDHLLANKSSSSSTSPTQSKGESATDTEKKRRGGWPKGKRRKPPPDIQVPRAPASGYLLYGIERRQEIKETNPEIAFAEVTKILGQEWSNMAGDKKQKYLDEAELDKKRYKEELKSFQQSEAYQNMLMRKKMKAGMRVQDGNWDADDNYTQLMSDMEDENMGDLYCRICDQYFSSLHNKKEHMLGRQHLQNMTGEIQKELNPASHSTNLSSSLNAVQPDISNHSNHSDSPPVGEKDASPVDVSGFIQGFLQDNYERELELKEIRKSLKNLQEENLSLYKQISDLKIYQNKLEEDSVTDKAINANLSSQMDGLKMVLTLFGVVNFQV